MALNVTVTQLESARAAVGSLMTPVVVMVTGVSAASLLTTTGLKTSYAFEPAPTLSTVASKSVSGMPDTAK